MKDSSEILSIQPVAFLKPKRCAGDEQVSVSNLNIAQGSDLDKGPYLRMSESREVAVEDLQPTSLANTGQRTVLLQAQMDPFSPIITVTNRTVFVSSSPPSGQLSKYTVDLQVY
jgi:hypothetical protein